MENIDIYCLIVLVVITYIAAIYNLLRHVKKQTKQRIDKDFQEATALENKYISATTRASFLEEE